ncbi:MAG: FimV/HubP family polar landmark protein [Methylococcaceae bacterium]
MNAMLRFSVVLVLLASGSACAEDSEASISTEAPDQPEAAQQEVVDRLERIEQTLRNLEQSLQNNPPILTDEVTETPADALPEGPVASDIQAEPPTPLPQPTPPPPQGIRLGGWLITVMEACFGLGIALMSVALGLVLGRRQPESRLTLKIAVNGQRRDTSDDGLEETATQGILNPEPVTPVGFLSAQDYGLVDLKPSDLPAEGSFSTPPADPPSLPDLAAAVPDNWPPADDLNLDTDVLDESAEKTIDEILRELTGQFGSHEEDPLRLLDQASGDYSRIPTIEQAMMTDSPLRKPTHAKTAFDSDYADLTDMDEIETQLDLARAYVDMGELDTARELLQEIEVMGTRAQQAEAKRWLKRCQEG